MNLSLEFLAGVAAALVLQAVVVGVTSLWRTSRYAVVRHQIVLLTFVVSIVLPIAAPFSPASLHWSIEDPRAGRVGDPVAGATPPGARRPLDPARLDPLPHTAPESARVPTVVVQPRSFPPEIIALLVFLAGFVVVTVRCAWGVVWLQRLQRSGSAIVSIGERASELAASLEVRPGSFRVLTSDQIASPLTFGPMRPVIVLPEPASRFEQEHLDTVLLHELSHVRRRDHVSIWLLNLGTAVFWFSPFAWLMASRAREDAEIATDAVAIGAGRVAARAYGRSLIEITRTLKSAPAVAAAVGVSGSQLSRRIEAICAGRSPLLRVSRWFTTATTAMLFTTGLLLASPRFSNGAYTDLSAAEAAGMEETGSVPVTDERVVLEIIETLRTDPDPMVRRSAVWELGQSPYVQSQEVQAALLASLSDPREEVRKSARIALGLIPDEPNKVFDDPGSQSTAPPVDLTEVTRMMNDRKAGIRLTAIRSLDGTNDPQAVALLEDALAHDQNDVVRSEAAAILGRVGDLDSVMVLIRAIEDSSWRVRQFAAGALGDQRDGRATLPLAAALRDPNEHVRQWAAGSLGDIGDVAGMAALIAATRDVDRHVRRTAVGALGGIGDPAAVPALLDAMRDDDPNVRRGAINSLGRIRGARDR